MHVCEAAGVAAEETEDQRRTSLRAVEVVKPSGGRDLVGLLEVLVILEIFADLRGKHIEGHFFELVGKTHVAGDLEHLFVGEHKFNRSAEFASVHGGIVAQGFIGPVHPVGPSAVAADIVHRLENRVEIFLLRVNLPPDHRLLEALGQVYSVYAALGGEHFTFEEFSRIVDSLPVKQLCKVQQPRLAGLAVIPQKHVQVVALAEFRPVGPLVDWLYRKRIQLIAEIAVEYVQHPAVFRSVVILLQYLEGHHLGPPVERLAPLETFYIRITFVRSEVAVGFGAVEHPVHPFLRFRLEGIVVQDIGEGEKTVHPVGAAFPAVAGASEPSVVRPEHLGISLVQVGGDAVPLADEHLFEPALRADGPERQFFITAIECYLAPAGCKRYQDEAKCENLFHAC